MDLRSQYLKDGEHLHLRDVLTIFLQVICSCQADSIAVLLLIAIERAFAVFDIEASLHGLQVCSGVRAMHRSSLAHRDIKPHNVLVSHPKATPDVASCGASTAFDPQVPSDDSAPELEPLQSPLSDPQNRSYFHAALMVQHSFSCSQLRWPSVKLS